MANYVAAEGGRRCRTRAPPARRSAISCNGRIAEVVAERVVDPLEAMESRKRRRFAGCAAVYPGAAGPSTRRGWAARVSASRVASCMIARLGLAAGDLLLSSPTRWFGGFELVGDARASTASAWRAVAPRRRGREWIAHSVPPTLATRRFARRHTAATRGRRIPVAAPAVVGEAQVQDSATDLEEAVTRQAPWAQNLARTRGHLRFNARARLEPLAVWVSTRLITDRRLRDACGEAGDRVQRRLRPGLDLQLLQPATGGAARERQRRHPARELGGWARCGSPALSRKASAPAGRVGEHSTSRGRQAGCGASPRGARPGVARGRRAPPRPLPWESEVGASTVSGAALRRDRDGRVLRRPLGLPAELRMVGKEADQVVRRAGNLRAVSDAHDGGSTRDRRHPCSASAPLAQRHLLAVRGGRPPAGEARRSASAAGHSSLNRPPGCRSLHAAGGAGAGACGRRLHSAARRFRAGLPSAGRRRGGGDTNSSLRFLGMRGLAPRRPGLGAPGGSATASPPPTAGLARDTLPEGAPSRALRPDPPARARTVTRRLPHIGESSLVDDAAAVGPPSSPTDA